MAEQLIFIADDEDAIRRMLAQKLTKGWGYKIRSITSGESVLAALDDMPDLILLDIALKEMGGVETLRNIKQYAPDIPVIMLSAEGNNEAIVESIKLGATDYLIKPIDITKLDVSVRTALKLSKLSKELARLRESLVETASSGIMIAESREMQLVERLIGKVKDSEISVLITGESGTGKELVARAIHFTGKRRHGPFIVVNCAAIPAELMESELFGHERGAFTGAVQRSIGKFEQANGGTIFLDEIADLNLALQAKFLRVLQSKEFERIGGSDTLKVDVRVISATNRNLKDAVKAKQFREDIYYRLASFPIHLPPLRERGADIIQLAEHFLKRFSEELKIRVKGFTREALEAIYRYPWPGNVRELESAIKRAVLLADGDIITMQDLPLVAQPFKDASMELETEGKLFHDNKIVPLDRIKEQAVRRAVEITRGNLALTARELDISRSTLYKLIERYEITV